MLLYISLALNPPGLLAINIYNNLLSLAISQMMSTPIIDLNTMNTVQIMEALYAKAMPGKKLVGFAAPAACEVAVKAPRSMQLEEKGMVVNFNLHKPNKTLSGLLYSKKQGGKNFVSTESTINVIKPKEVDNLASDSFYAAAKLGAFQSAVKGSAEDVNILMEHMYGDNAPHVDEYMPNLKDSWNVRSLVPSGKSHHAIFGESTLVASVAINTEKFVKKDADEAIDWGRIYLSLKFVGAINLKFDGALARQVGKLYFTTPAHNWPIMPKETFVIPKKLLKLVMKPVTNQFLAPLEDAEELETQLIERFDLAKKYAAKHTLYSTEFLEASREMVLKRIWNRKATVPMITRIPADFNSVVMEPLSSQQVREKYVDNFMHEYKQVMAKIMGKIFLVNPDARKELVSILRTRRSGFGSGSIKSLEILSKTIFTPKHLVDVAKHLTHLGFNGVEKELLRRWSALAGAPLQLNEAGYFAAIVKTATNSPKTFEDTILALWDALPHAAYDFTVSPIIGSPLENIVSLIGSVEENFNRIKRFWTNRYFTMADVEKRSSKSIMLQQLSKSFKYIDITTLLLYPMVWHDPGSDKPHFYIDAAQKYARKRRKTLDNILPNLNLVIVGEMIDKKFSKKPKISWAAVAMTIDKKLTQLRNDLIRILRMHQVKVDVDDYAFDEGPFNVIKARKVGFQDGEDHTFGTKDDKMEILEDEGEKIDLDFLDTIDLGDSWTTNVKTDDQVFDEILSTWPNPNDADALAQVEGFRDFRQWYDYNPDNPVLIFDEVTTLPAVLIARAARDNANNRMEAPEEEDYIEGF